MYDQKSCHLIHCKLFQSFAHVRCILDCVSLAGIVFSQNAQSHTFTAKQKIKQITHKTWFD
jgi:hypothetical protein